MPLLPLSSCSSNSVMHLMYIDDTSLNVMWLGGSIRSVELSVSDRFIFYQQ